MPSVPRYMKFSTELHKVIGPALERLVDDPAFRIEWQRMGVLLRCLYRCTPAQYQDVFVTAPSMAVILTTVCSVSPYLEPLCDRFATDMQDLMTLCAEKAPDLVRIYGPHLGEFLSLGLYCVVGLESPSTWGRRVHHLALDNPLMITADGTLAGWEEAKPQHSLQLDAYRQSLRPPQKRGPKPTAAAQIARAPRRLDPVMAARASALRGNGAKWRTIARELFPHARLNEAMRKKIDRLIYLGNMNARRTQ